MPAKKRQTKKQSLASSKKSTAPSQKNRIKHHAHKLKKHLTVKKTSFVVGTLAIAIAIFVGIAVSGSNESAKKSINTDIPQAAYISLESPSRIARIGDIVSINVFSFSKDTKTNAVQARIQYPADKLKFLGINSDASAYPIKAFEADKNGTVEVARGIIGGVSDKNLVATIQFKATASGPVVFSYDKSATLLVSQDNNQNLLNEQNLKTTNLEVE